MKSPFPALRGLLASHFAIAIALALIVVTMLGPVALMVARGRISLEFLALPAVFFVLLLAFGYGAVRGWLYHPVFNDRYRRWLARSPWSPELPLPTGPVHLVWSDGIVVGAMCVVTGFLAWTLTLPLWQLLFGPILLFALAITIMWTAVNVLVDQRGYVYAVAAVPAVYAVVGIPHLGFLTCPIVMAGIAWLGVRRSLTTFPWSDETLLWNRLAARRTVLAGWPYRALLRPVAEIRTSRGRALVEAALVAGWVWVLFRFFKPPLTKGDQAAALFCVGVFATIAACVRLGYYGPVLCDSLCWGQRIANRRWLIWRHDQIFLAPVLMATVGWVAPRLLQLTLPLGVSCAVTAGAVVMLGRTMGPDVGELLYTGVHSKFGRFRATKDFVTARGSDS